MGKLTTYLLIISGIMLLMYFSGFVSINECSNTAYFTKDSCETAGGTWKNTNALLTLLLDPQNVGLSDFFDDVWDVLNLVGLLGILITSIVSRNPDYAIFGGAAIAIFNLGITFIGVFVALDASSNHAYTPILILLFSPLILLFLVTIMEWYRGVTT